MSITKPTITLIIEYTEDRPSFLKNIEIHNNELITYNQIIFISDLANIDEFYPDTFIQAASKGNLIELIKTVKTDLIGYVPCGTTALAPLTEIEITSNFIATWLPDVTLPEETAKMMPFDAVAWIASTSLIKSVLPQLDKLNNWTLLKLANTLEKGGIPFQWKAVRASISEITRSDRISQTPLTINSKILAIVPHYRCETWLRRCLESLVNQTRSLDNIVVVDDNSTTPPKSIVAEFPNVTLLTSPFNVGPYRLIQQVIEDTNYNGYLFQDADDWSASDRLEKLLVAAEITNAELIGTQEFRVFEERLTPVCYPLDVNAALAEKPGHPLLHPTSLVARDLVLRLGGFATGLKFGGDTEFLLRAALAAKIVNVPYYCYFRRHRTNSLTTAPDTGLDSPARVELHKTLKSRALTNYAMRRSGQQPRLMPLLKEAPIKLSYVTGPKLHSL